MIFYKERLAELIKAWDRRSQDVADGLGHKVQADVIDAAVWDAITQATQEPSAVQTTQGNTSIYIDAERRLKLISRRHSEIMK